MKIKKVTQFLILISIVGVVFDLVRWDIWKTADSLFLIWNIFLAWIPYFISSFFIKKDMSLKYFAGFFILWLLFFPNAPYLVTDVLHLAGRMSQSLWYDSLLYFFFGWIGLLLGMLSLFHIHQYLKTHFNNLISEIIIFCICFVSSLGVYLGRFERWNSWDVVLNPFQLVRRSFYLSTNLIHAETPLMFVIVFTLFTYFVYQMIYVLITNKTEEL